MDFDKNIENISTPTDQVRPLFEEQSDIDCATVFFSPFAGFILLLMTIRRLSIYRSLNMSQLQQSCIALLNDNQHEKFKADPILKCMFPWDADGQFDQNIWPVPDPVILKPQCSRLRDILYSKHDVTSGEFDGAQTWGAVILHSFAQCLKGLENSSVDYIVKQFLRRPGCVSIDKKNIMVKLEPVPLGVVLKMADFLGWQGSLPWLNNKEFTIELCA